MVVVLVVVVVVVAVVVVSSSSFGIKVNVDFLQPVAFQGLPWLPAWPFKLRVHRVWGPGGELHEFIMLGAGSGAR